MADMDKDIEANMDTSVDKSDIIKAKAIDEKVAKLEKLVDKLHDEHLQIDKRLKNEFLDMTFDAKVVKIKELVDKLLENCNTYDKQYKQSQVEVESKNSTLSQLNDLLKVDETILLEHGHDSQSDKDMLTQEFFNYCVVKCIKERKLEFMIVVALLLPDIIEQSYKSTVSNLIMQLSYVKIPSEWCDDENPIQFYSIREDLWGYKFPDHNSSLSSFEKFAYKPPFTFTLLTYFSETIPPHSATLCYVPLPGLCTYPKSSGVFNTLFPHHLSPFATLIASYSSEILDISQASSQIYEHAPFQAIIKFKWHAFARLRFFVVILIYFGHFTCYTMAFFKTNKTTEGRGLMISSIILGAVLMFTIIRYFIISLLNKNVTIDILVIYSFITHVLSTITGFVFLLYSSPENFLGVQSISIFLSWVSMIGYLCVFKKIGIFIIGKKRILMPLFLLVLVLLAVAHAAVIYIDPKVTGVNGEPKYNDGDMLHALYKSFINAWDSFQSNGYSLPIPLKDDFWLNISKIAFSFFTSIVILNLLIAFVNNIYGEVDKRAYAEWTMARAECIVYVELFCMTPLERQNRDYFPLMVTYEAFTEKVEEWPNNLKKRNVPIPWEDRTSLLSTIIDFL